MSTKIYNGYLLRDMDLMSLQNFSLDLRQKINSKVYDLVGSLSGNLASLIIDAYTLHGKEKAINYLLDIDGKIDTKEEIGYFIQNMIRERDKKIRDTKERDPDFDFQFEVCFIPIGTNVYSLIYTEQEEFVKIWESMDKVVEYGYWNNTDRPKDITEEEWERRSKEWDLALPGIGIPAENGFKIQCILNTPRCPNAIMVKYIPSLEERAIKQAKQSIFNDKYEKFYEELGEGKYGRAYFKANQFVNSDEGIKEVEKLTKEYKKILKQEITTKDLDLSLDEFLNLYVK